MNRLTITVKLYLLIALFLICAGGTNLLLLERLSSVWSAPFPQYAPPFVRRPAFGYVMSAMFGSGLILGFFLTAGSIIGSNPRSISGAKNGRASSIKPVRSGAENAGAKGSS